MSEEIKEEIQEEDHKEDHKEEPKKKKGVLGKIKDNILPDADEQAAIISTFVRLGVLVWSGGILTLNYVAIPGVPQQKIDPTFIASVFTGVLASFGIQTASKKGDGTMKMNGNGSSAPQVSKADMEKLIEKATQTAPAQIIRIEQAPLNLTAAAQPPKTDEKPYKL
tara:strand:- start:1214 stop:1711 length:498 start_codon:yes stop_codon:yes gene_type:complete